MIVAVDVNYLEDSAAIAAGIVFSDFCDVSYTSEYWKRIDEVEAYVPGAFYKRELPCILAVLQEITEPVEVVIVDGYVNLGNRPGLGAHLRISLGKDISVIGVAKSRFAGSNAIEVFRGESRRPLYVTSSGMAPSEAACRIRAMHGKNRIPTLLKAVDSLTKAERSIKSLGSHLPLNSKSLPTAILSRPSTSKRPVLW